MRVNAVQETGISIMWSTAPFASDREIINIQHDWPFWEENPPMTGDFPSQRVTNIRMIIIWYLAM